MMKKRLEALLFAMILLLTAMGGAAAEEKEPCLVLNAVARYPREIYPLDLMGMTEEIPYLLTVTNTGGAACALSHLRCQIGDAWKASSFLNTVLEPGQSVTFLHSQRFFRDDLVPGTASEGTLGTVEIVFTVHGGESGEYASNEARFAHRISAAKADFPTVGAEQVQTELQVIGASVHPAGYQAGEIDAAPLCDQKLKGPCETCDYAAICRRDVSRAPENARLMQEMRFDALIEKINRPPTEREH